jgi:hypothetical protein
MTDTYAIRVARHEDLAILPGIGSNQGMAWLLLLLSGTVV